MIEAEHLLKRFGSITAVNDVSFRVMPGEVVGFLGANGAGKSTTMRLLTGSLLADSGKAQLNGHNIANNRQAAQQLIGYLPESASGFPHLTVKDFLTFAGEARGLWGKVLSRAIGIVSEQVDLQPALHRRMSELSKGWRQRAWFAQAMLHDPPILILDEPTDGLDPNQKDKTRALIRDVSREKAIIFSSHILEEAEELCERVVIITDGRIVFDGPTREIADDRGRLAPAFRRLTKSADDISGANL